MSTLKVIRIGLGPNGQRVVKYLLEREGLEFVAAVGQADPADTVEIIGDPPIKSVISGGVNGDVATCAITVNAIKSIVTAPPGLRTMADIPPVTFFEAF